MISLSLKSARQPNWELAYSCLKEAIGNEFEHHMNILNSLPVKAARMKFHKLLERSGSEADYATSLAFLSRCLEQVQKNQ